MWSLGWDQSFSLFHRRTSLLRATEPQKYCCPRPLEPLFSFSMALHSRTNTLDVVESFMEGGEGSSFLSPPPQFPPGEINDAQKNRSLWEPKDVTGLQLPVNGLRKFLFLSPFLRPGAEGGNPVVSPRGEAKTRLFSPFFFLLMRRGENGVGATRGVESLVPQTKRWLGDSTPPRKYAENQFRWAPPVFRLARSRRRN